MKKLFLLFFFAAVFNATTSYGQNGWSLSIKNFTNKYIALKAGGSSSPSSFSGSTTNIDVTPKGTSTYSNGTWGIQNNWAQYLRVELVSKTYWPSIPSSSNVFIYEIKQSYPGTKTLVWSSASYFGAWNLSHTTSLSPQTLYFEIHDTQVY